MTWKEWVVWYGLLFGLVTERDAAMMMSWIKEVFAPQGFTADELKDAGQKIARSDPPRFREQHLSRLSAEVRAARAAKFVARPADDWSDCKDCGGTGLVTVPQDKPSFLSRARGHHDTCLVICCCPAGVAFGRRTRPDWMTLEQYEAVQPLWRDTLAEWREEDRAYQRAHGHALEADRTLGAIVQRLAGKTQGERKRG